MEHLIKQYEVQGDFYTDFLNEDGSAMRSGKGKSKEDSESHLRVLLKELRLPSHLQINDYADVILTKEGLSSRANMLSAGKVIKVHFTESKVTYDFEFTTAIEDNHRYTTRIHNVDSAFVVKRDNEVTV